MGQNRIGNIVWVGYYANGCLAFETQVFFIKTTWLNGNYFSNVSFFNTKNMAESERFTLFKFDANFLHFRKKIYLHQEKTSF